MGSFQTHYVKQVQNYSCCANLIYKCEVYEVEENNHRGEKAKAWETFGELDIMDFKKANTFMPV